MKKRVFRSREKKVEVIFFLAYLEVKVMVLGTCHLNTPNGLLKVFHLLLGAISLLLVGTSYVPYWALDVFFVAVAVCFGFSAFYLLLHLILGDEFSQSKANRIASCIFHIVAGTFLIVAGIDLIGWSDYDVKCGFKCPHIYNIGVAKILTFINGTLYGIHGFLEARGDDEDFINESVPLLSFQVQVHPPPEEPKPHCSTNNNVYTIHTNSINY